MTATIPALYAPPDVEDAWNLWSASCGPSAFAAVVRRPLSEVHAFFPDIETRHYVNPTHMQEALRLAGRRMRRCDVQERESLALPYGLAFLCFTGPWTKPGVPIAAAYARSHWIGVALDAEYGYMAYDINASTRSSPQGAWVPWSWWEVEILPQLCTQYGKADGGYLVRWACEIVQEEPS